MTIHKDIDAVIREEMSRLDGVVSLSYTPVAKAALDRFSDGKLSPHIEYAALEYFKAATRKVMVKDYGPDISQATITPDQGEMFSGRLQARYPVKTKRGQDPIYKRLENLTNEELLWLERQFHKLGKSCIAHGDAIGAYRRQKFETPNDNDPQPCPAAANEGA